MIDFMERLSAIKQSTGLGARYGHTLWLSLEKRVKNVHASFTGSLDLKRIGFFRSGELLNFLAQFCTPSV